MEDFCRSCVQCQKSSGRKVPPAPLIPLPVISEPFSRIVMDIIGPLPRSKSGNKYILVLCDYATRYPEAVPLHSIDAVHIAEELIKVFARVGVPLTRVVTLPPNYWLNYIGYYIFTPSETVRTIHKRMV